MTESDQSTHAATKLQLIDKHSTLLLTYRTQTRDHYGFGFFTLFEVQGIFLHLLKFIVLIISSETGKGTETFNRAEVPHAIYQEETS